jgi:hypothetical protein
MKDRNQSLSKIDATATDGLVLLWSGPVRSLVFFRSYGPDLKTLLFKTPTKTGLS